MQVLAQKPESNPTITKEMVRLPKVLPYESPSKAGLDSAFDKFPHKDQVKKTAMG